MLIQVKTIERKSSREKTQGGTKTFSYPLFLVIVLLLGRESFAAPLRVFLPIVWYLPDIMAAIFIGFFLLKETKQGSPLPLLLAIGFIVWILASFAFLSPLSIFFAIRPFLALILGIVAGREYLLDDKKMRWVLALFCCAIVGSVLYDKFFGLNWGDAFFSSVIGQRTIGRTWWADYDIRRVSGFAVASTEAAFIISTSFLLLMPKESRLKLFISLLCLVPCAYALWLTLQKATTGITFFLIALTVLSVFFLGRNAKKILGPTLKSITLIGLIACISVPFIFYNVDVGSIFNQDMPSLKDRTFSVWPMAISRLFSFPTLFTGSGFGSVGESASFTDVALAVPPDNLFLYLSLYVGIFFSIACIIAVFRIILRADTSKASVISCLSIAVLFIINGVTANILAGTVSNFYMGYALVYLLRNPKKKPPMNQLLKPPGKNYANPAFFP